MNRNYRNSNPVPYTHVACTCACICTTVERLYYGDTLGTSENVLSSEMSSFQGQFCTQLYLAGTLDSFLIKGDVLISGVSL